MDPSLFGGIGVPHNVHEEGSGSVPFFRGPPSCLALMASVVPPGGIPEQRSAPHFYPHYIGLPPPTSFNVEFQSRSTPSTREINLSPNVCQSHIAPVNPTIQHSKQITSTDYSSSEDDQLERFGTDYSGDESDAAPDNQLVEHQTLGDYSPSNYDTCPRTKPDVLIGCSEEDINNKYFYEKTDSAPLDESLPHSDCDVAVGYSSADDYTRPPNASSATALLSADKETSFGAVEPQTSNSNDVPTEHILVPTVGLVFPTLDDAYQFYNLYSWELGFSIRKGTSLDGPKNADGIKIRNMQEYRCQRAGKPAASTKHSTTMCHCPARLRVLRNKENEYYVSIFVAEHNHDLVDSYGEKRHLKSHQFIDQATKDMVRRLRENNVSLSKVNSIMGSMSGSMSNLTFSKRRLKNVCQDIASELIANDIQKTMLSLMKLRDEDPNFVYSFQMDKDSRITSLMWSNGNSRKMYSYFGDVVTFDTTYKTNLYNMPFGMFVGVNNHFQSVIFAGVLLTRETTESFAWAFKTFVEMMGGKAPVTMLTDQAAAMGAALRQVLSNTRHRWCKWHVLKKLVEMLGHLFNKHKEFQDDFNKVVNHMLSVTEFEDSWAAMVAKYGLVNNPEITRAFESRSMWAKAWFKDIFCARMTSTQRSESANNVLKHFVPRNSPLNLFVQQYNKLVTELEKADFDEEHRTKQRDIYLRFGWPIERHAAHIYTRAAYNLFLQELARTTSYTIVDSNVTSCYKVVHVESERREKWSKVDFNVSVNEASGLYDCECGLFNHFGILCCHALLVLVQKGIREIPAIHIMNRWTKSARLKEPGHLLPAVKPTKAAHSKALKINMLDRTLREVAKLADLDSETLDYAMSQATSFLKKLQERHDAFRTDCHVGYESSCSEGFGRATSGSDILSDSDVRPLHIVDSRSGVSINVSSIKPPAFTRANGRPSNMRIKGAAEVRIRSSSYRKKRSRSQTSSAIKQSRHCKKCRSNDHDSRRCPGVNPLSPVGEENNNDLV